MYRLTAQMFRNLAAMTVCCLSVVLPMSSNATIEEQWRFRVYLDDKEIGYHHFTLTQSGAQERLDTRAEFDITFLRLPLFSYRHSNVEHWNNNCLQRITSHTDQNGTQFRVEGMATDDGFMITSNSGESTLPSCISSFAYWDKAFLEQDRLLNSQTGDYVDVVVEYLGENTLTIAESAVPAQHYRLTAGDLDIEVWYAHDGRWLALQSTTTDGSLLRYVAE
jgi:hypothetical protein